MPNRKIAIVDDDDDLRGTIAMFLNREGFDVEEYMTGGALLENLTNGASVDLVLLDLMLNGEDGLELAPQIRTLTDVPLIMLTGRSDVIDRIVGLEIGADDYVTKPFHNRELLARIRAVLRRGSSGGAGDLKNQQSSVKDVVHFDGWVLDKLAQSLRSPCGDDVAITSQEFRALEALSDAPKRVLSRDHLMDRIAGRDWSPVGRSIDVIIGKLRKKLNDNPKSPRYIRTVRNGGYMFLPDFQQ